MELLFLHFSKLIGGEIPGITIDPWVANPLGPVLFIFADRQPVQHTGIEPV